MAFRLPTTDLVVDLTCRLKDGATYDDIIVKDAVEGDMRGVRDSMDDKLVSNEFVLCEASSISGIGSDIALNDKFAKLVTWYGNEWSYSSHLVDWAIYMQSIDG